MTWTGGTESHGVFIDVVGSHIVLRSVHDAVSSSLGLRYGARELSFEEAMDVLELLERAVAAATDNALEAAEKAELTFGPALSDGDKRPLLVNPYKSATRALEAITGHSHNKPPADALAEAIRELGHGLGSLARQTLGEQVTR